MSLHTTPKQFLFFYTLVLLIALIASSFGPSDTLTWWLEVLPVVIALPILWMTLKRFPLTPILYFFIAVHGLILILGGAYTYAKVPLGFWMQEWLELSRNPYDKIGHFAQGFVPALVAREILIRHRIVSGAKMLAFIVICIALAISAVYELIEWAAALAVGEDAESFLGTQGDEWDTQSDMFLALLGALSALAVLSRLHDKQIARLMPSTHA